MLNLWKKIQERGRINSPKKNIDVAALGPQYDGPLRFFDCDGSGTYSILLCCKCTSYNKSLLMIPVDVTPLEKCRLTLNHMHDTYENKSAYIYFKSFLESKMVVEILLLYNSILREEKEQHFLIPDKELNEDKSPSDITEGHVDFVTGSPTLTSLLSKLPEEIQIKLTQARVASESSSNNIDVAVLKLILYQVLLEYVQFLCSLSRRNACVPS